MKPNPFSLVSSGVVTTIAVLLTFTGSASAVLVTGLTNTGSLISFDSSSPGSAVTGATVTGIASGQILIGIDYRPIDSALVGVGYNSSTGAVGVYSISTANGVATSINANSLNIGTALTRVTADFNPTANAIRVVTNGSGSNNFRIPTAGTGALATDTNISGSPSITGTAYSRNIAGGGANGRTTLYEISGSGNSLVTQGSIDFFTGSGTSPNSGTLFTVATLTGIAGSSVVDMDIFSTAPGGPNTADVGQAFVSDGTGFYSLDLNTGAATLLGNVPVGSSLVSFATVPEPSGVILGAVGVLGALGLRRRRN